MRLSIAALFLLAISTLPPCAYPRMNTLEFEHHSEKELYLISSYGIDNGDYQDADIPSFQPFGQSSEGMYARNSLGAELVHLEPAGILIGTKECERALLPLCWAGEIPPREFAGRLFIRVFNLEEGLLHWDPDPFATWGYGEGGD